MSNDWTPQGEVAKQFMSDKGYPNARPKDVSKLEGRDCWYFVYDIIGGTLELEVSWEGRWNTLVTTFQNARTAG